MKTDSALSEKSFDKLNRLSNRLNLDENTKLKASRLYLEYSEKKKMAISWEKNELAIRTAVLVASRAQEVVTIEGHKSRGIGLRPTQILNDAKFELGDFILLLKDFLNTVIIDKEVDLEMRKLIEDFSFSLKFYEKYENILEKLAFDLAGATEGRSSGYKKLFKQYGWLLFVMARKEILNNCTEIHQNLFLMGTLFHFLTVHCPEEFVSKYFTDLIGPCKLYFVIENFSFLLMNFFLNFFRRYFECEDNRFGDYRNEVNIFD